MASILTLNQDTLRTIILLTCNGEENPTQVYLVNQRFAALFAQLQAHFTLYNNLERFKFSNWKVSDLKKRLKHCPESIEPALREQLIIWDEKNEYYRRRIKLEVQRQKFEYLFGGAEAYENIPNANTSCHNLIFDRLPPEELASPIMKGHDAVGHQFVAVKIPTTRDRKGPVVLYLFIYMSYWTLQHWSGDRQLLGKTAAYLTCLIEPYGFNPATYGFCRNLFTKILQNKDTFRIRASL